jgi:oligopeptide/dipeptide ABC transporter ATP-binding protein
MRLVISAEGLEVRFPAGGTPWRPRWLTALSGAELALQRGETLGVVGESGCGKSTLGRALLGLVPLHSGSVVLDGQRIEGRTAGSLRRLRRHAQMVFQDPQGSLDPRMTIAQSVAEPLEVHEPGLPRRSLRERVLDTLLQVGLSPEHGDRFPHELSGGQCQRAGIARAVIIRPSLLVCDEPVSALDVSVQGQVVNLLLDLQQSLGLACLFISHNLAVVRHVSDRLLVMYLGRVVESAPRDALFDRPLHPYTRALLDAVPSPEPGQAGRAPVLAGDLPSPLSPPPGCPFSTRCRFALSRCRVDPPLPEDAGPSHTVACHRWREWPAGLVASRDA